MAKAITEVAIGAAAIGASFLVPGAGIAIAGLHLSQAAAVGALMSVGGSQVMAGLADALKQNQGGLAVAVATPIGPWGYVYGRQKVGGVEIFRQSNNNTGGSGETSNNKQLHRVYVLACHPCALGSWQLRIDGKQVLVTPNGPGFQSYSPTQIMRAITSISRNADGLVTVVIEAGIAGLDGQTIGITECSDNTLNGLWILTQPNPADTTTFTFVSGGPEVSLTGSGQFSTCYSDYKDKIYVEFLDGSHSATFSRLLAAGTSWRASDKLLGLTAVYVQMGYDEGVFPSSIPNVSFVIDGKNDILDPRTGLRGLTKNAALCIADYLSLPRTRGGFGLEIGTDIPTDGLIAAANVCDEAVPLAAGGTIARYTINTFFQLNETRGAVLEQLLTACAGRLSYQGGTYTIFPGAWVAPSLQLSDADLVGPVQVKPRLSIRETANAVKGTYVSPENNYQQADLPPYMQDWMHGYGLETDPGQGDQWLVEDNFERIFRESNFACTDNAATAQRLAKIGLLRLRNQLRVTVHATMKAYRAVALDVIEISHPRYGWVNKNFEVLASRLVVDKSGDAPRLTVELDLAETDATIFDWSTAEELTPYGYIQPSNVGAQVVSPPEGLIVYSGPGETTGGIVYPSTVTVGADGVAHNSLYVLWTPPNDAFVTGGGEIEVQYQAAGAAEWTELGKYHGAMSGVFVPNVIDGASYNVRARAISTAGYPSAWIEVDGHVVSDTYSIITSRGLNPNSPWNINNDAVLDSVLDDFGTAAIRAYGPGGVGTAWDNYNGQGSTTYPAGGLYGLAFSTVYTIVWDVAGAWYAAVANYNDALSDAYVMVGNVKTCDAAGSGGGSGGGGGTGTGGGGPRTLPVVLP